MARMSHGSNRRAKPRRAAAGEKVMEAAQHPLAEVAEAIRGAVVAITVRSPAPRPQEGGTAPAAAEPAMGAGGDRRQTRTVEETVNRVPPLRGLTRAVRQAAQSG